MAAKGTSYLQGLLDLIFNNTALALIGDASGLQPSATAGSLYVSLHTADPLPTSSQSTNETTYTPYGRIAVARSGAGWTRSGNFVSPVSAVTFATCTVGTPTLTHAGIGTASSGAGKLLYSGPITPNIAVAPTITPQLTTASTVTET